MTNQHPITPPPWELVEEWMAEVWHEGSPVQVSASDVHVATRAAQWSADQELEACIDWISVYHGLEHPELLIELLRAARRPKPPSLKELALEQLDSIQGLLDSKELRSDSIRRALEALPDD